MEWYDQYSGECSGHLLTSLSITRQRSKTCYQITNWDFRFIVDTGGFAAGERIHMNNKIVNYQRFEKFLRFVTKTNILAVRRKRCTWMVSYKNTEGKLSQVYWQFSFKKPWLIPHFDDGTSGPRTGMLPLYGWLFFYFGKNTRPLA